MRRTWLALIRSFALPAGTFFLAVPAPLIGSAPTPSPDQNEVAPTVEQATEQSEERPFIGIEMASPTDGGIPVTAVTPDTAAERFGLEVGDVILRIGEVATDSLGSVADALASRRPGDVVEIELLRAGKRQTIRLELGVRPDDLELRRDEADHVLGVLQIRPGLDVADIGCGSGWLSEAIAIELGGSGTVYAVELEESHIASLRRRELPGVVPVLSEPGDISLPEESLDIAVLHDVASHVDSDARQSFYGSVRRALRPGGRLVIFGPHGDAETMLAVLEAHAFAPVNEDDLDGLPPDDLDRRLAEGIVFRFAPGGAPPDP
jgi:SAM-dependent methyltransferase